MKTVDKSLLEKIFLGHQAKYADEESIWIYDDLRTFKKKWPKPIKNLVYNNSKIIDYLISVPTKSLVMMSKLYLDVEQFRRFIAELPAHQLRNFSAFFFSHLAKRPDYYIDFILQSQMLIASKDFELINIQYIIESYKKLDMLSSLTKIFLRQPKVKRYIKGNNITLPPFD